MRRCALALLALGCATTVLGGHTVLPEAPETARALQIVGGVYGVDLHALKVVFFQPECDAGAAGRYTPETGPGMYTGKHNCTRGSLAPYQWQVNIAWPVGMQFSHSGFSQACWEAYEYATYKLPDVYQIQPWWVDGTARRKLDEAAAALKKAGL
jgi:hypothetical protein